MFQPIRLLRFPLLLLLLLPNLAEGQTLDVLQVDPIGYPRIEARVLVLDAERKPLPVDASEMSVSVGGEIVPVTSLNCPAPGVARPVKVVLVVDRSGSMNRRIAEGPEALDLVREGINVFLDDLEFISGTEVALTAFSDQPVLLSGFRNDPAPIRTALSRLVPDGGTEYDPAFLDAFSGAISLLETADPAVDRRIIFITDGAPSTPPDQQGIINRAVAAGITVNTIAIDARAIPFLSAVANSTGGTLFESVSSQSELSGILRLLALESSGIAPCVVRWDSPIVCRESGLTQEAELQIPTLGLSDSFSYTVPAEPTAHLDVSAKYLWFGAVAFPASASQTLTIRAVNADFEVTDALFSDIDHFQVESWGGSLPPFTLRIGESREISIRFSPTDSGGVAALLRLQATPCPSREIVLAGGNRGAADREPLVLRTPQAGDSFDGCDSVPVVWGGVPPDRPIRIEYRREGSSEWRTIEDSAADYRWDWSPPGPAADYLIRIASYATEQHVIYTIAGGGDTVEDGTLATEIALFLPYEMTRVGDTVYFTEQGRHSVRGIDMNSLLTWTVAGSGVPGNGGDGFPATTARLNSPRGLTVVGDTLFIADANNHRIRKVDLRTGIISTRAGTGVSDYTGDGGDPRLASMRFPTGLVHHGRYLYFTEVGNDIVRRIDLVADTIGTFAGGGTSFDSDGVNARRALLAEPMGMIVREGSLLIAERDAGRIRTIDLMSGIIGTVAGTGRVGSSGDGGPATSAELNGPVSLTATDDYLYISESLGSAIRRVSLEGRIIETFAGQGTSGFSGDSGAAANARFQAPQGLSHWGNWVLVADRGNHRIRAITLYRPDGLDSTRGTFAVVAPDLAIDSEPLGSRFDVGRTGIGTLRVRIDSLLCNIGTDVLSIDSFRVGGPDAGLFRIIAPGPTSGISPGVCGELAIEYRPETAGRSEAHVVFFPSCGEPDTLYLTGTGVVPCQIESLPSIDLGSLAIGSSRDSNLVEALCNLSVGMLPGRYELISPDGAFSLPQGESTFSVSPSRCLPIQVRFTPTGRGPSMALLRFLLDSSECGIREIPIRGIGLLPGTLGADTLIARTACAGELVTATARLYNRGDLPLSVSAFSGSVEIADGPSLPHEILPGDSAEFDLRTTYTTAGVHRDMLRWITAEGDTVVTELTVRVDSAGAEISSSHSIPRTSLSTLPFDTLVSITNTGTTPLTVLSGQLDQTLTAIGSLIGSEYPLVIQPGTSDQVTLRVSSAPPAEGVFGEIKWVLASICPLDTLRTEVIVSGTAPLLLGAAPDSITLLCDPTPDTLAIPLRNAGGANLTIASAAVTGADQGSFSLLTSVPIDLLPGESVVLLVEYLPTAIGSHAGNLELNHNGAGETEFPLRGWFGRSIPVLSPSEVNLVRTSPGGIVRDTLRLVNDGNRPVDPIVSVPSPGTFRLMGPTPVAPGDTLEIEINLPEGLDSATVGVVDQTCGVSNFSEITVRQAASAMVTLRVGSDTVGAGDPVILPVTVGLPQEDRLPAGVGYRVRLGFVGTTFYLDEVPNATVTRVSWDPNSEWLVVDVTGLVPTIRPDLLFSLIGRGLHGRYAYTDVEILEVTWSQPNIETITLDGHLLVEDLCPVPGLHYHLDLQ